MSEANDDCWDATTVTRETLLSSQADNFTVAVGFEGKIFHQMFNKRLIMGKYHLPLAHVSSNPNTCWVDADLQIAQSMMGPLTHQKGN